MPIRAYLNATPDVGLSDASKEEKLVEVAVTHQFCVLRRQGCVLRQLPRRQRPHRHYRNAGFRGQRLQSFRCRRLGRRNRQACETAKAHGFRRTQVEIAFRKVNSAASFRDEWMVMAQFSAWIINLQAGGGGYPNPPDGRVGHLRAEHLASRRPLPPNRCQALTMPDTNRGRLK